MSTRDLHSPMTRKYKVLIVDDHPIVRHGLSELTARQPDLEVSGEAANVSEALEQIETNRPDAAVIDIALDGENGLELIERITELLKESQVAGVFLGCYHLHFRWRVFFAITAQRRHGHLLQNRVYRANIFF